MCGFAGFASPDGLPGSGGDSNALLERMGEAIRHRGPDAGGIWLDEKLSVGLSHRRLSIIDLSELGAQPMASGTGRYVIAFNGEIYNFRKLRAELEETGDFKSLHAVLLGLWSLLDEQGTYPHMMQVLPGA